MCTDCLEIKIVSNHLYFAIQTGCYVFNTQETVLCLVFELKVRIFEI